MLYPLSYEGGVGHSVVGLCRRRAMLSAMQGWETFAAITGSAAAALIGLLFVVVSRQ
jgi:hypothetical protein